jgi:ribonuclease HIII
LTQNKAAFNKFKDSVTQAVTARDNFKQKVDTFKKQFPLRAAEFEAKLQQMTAKIERKKEALSQAKDQLALGEAKLEEMQAYWQMSQAMQDANKAAGLDTEDVFTQLKMDTAVDSVFESMNKAFAQLEVEDHLADDGAMSLENKPSETIRPVVQAQHVKTL